MHAEEPTVDIDGELLLHRLHKMGAIGRDQHRRLIRLAATDDDRRARDTLIRWATDAGLEVEVDCVGNIVVVLDTPQIRDRPPVVIGSHIDTVVDAGIYDGCYGVLAGLSVLQTLRADVDRFIKPLIVVAFTNEEGVRFSPDLLGSRVFAGHMTVSDALAVKDNAGITLGSELRRIGHLGDRPQKNQLPSAYIELHIEQGPVLDCNGSVIGVVEAIQGTRWWRISFEGSANHAGTTPLEMRRDAGQAAVAIAHSVNEFVRANRTLVATAGRIIFKPNAINVIPSQAELTLDVRSHHDRELEKFAIWLIDRITEISRSCNVVVEIEELASTPPVHFNTSLQEEIKRSAIARGLAFQSIASGANHDAQNFSNIAPTGMIFVPSVGGISHNPKEFTRPEHLVAGANVLLDVVSSLVIGRRSK